MTSQQTSSVLSRVHEHLGLDDRDDPCLLAERGVARERVRVRAQVAASVGMPSPIVITARHFAKRAPSPRYSSRRARSPSSPSVTFSPGKPGVVVRARVDLDPRDDALRGQHLGERRPVVGRLADRLVVEDHAADGVLHPGRREQELPVEASVLLRRLDADRVEALLDRPGATRPPRGCPCCRRRSPPRCRAARALPSSALLSSGSGSSSVDATRRFGGRSPSASASRSTRSRRGRRRRARPGGARRS